MRPCEKSGDDPLNEGEGSVVNRIQVEKQLELKSEVKVFPVRISQVFMNLLSNAVQAIPDHGRIQVHTVEIQNAGEHSAVIEISDNGVGMPSKFADKKAGSLGMSLMAGLSEDLNGTFSLENNNGTIIKISFERDISVKHQSILAESIVSNN